MLDNASTSASESTPAHAHLTRHWLRWAAIAMALVPALILAAALLIAFMDWNKLRPWINEIVSTSTGRDFAIKGDLQLQWTWPQPLDTGWRHWVPGVVVHASDLTLSHPEGWLVHQAPEKSDGKQPVLPAAPKELNTGRLPGQGQAANEKKTASDDEDAIADAGRQPPERDARTMITAAKATASLRLWPLLARHVQLDSLLLQAPDMVLARNDKGENNWTFDKPASSEPKWSFEIGQLRISDGVLGWSDAIKNMAVRARIDTLRRPVKPINLMACALASLAICTKAIPSRKFRPRVWRDRYWICARTGCAFRCAYRPGPAACKPLPKGSSTIPRHWTDWTFKFRCAARAWPTCSSSAACCCPSLRRSRPAAV